MCSECGTEGYAPSISRGRFLKLGGVGLAGAVLLGSAGGRSLAQSGSLKSEFDAASEEYGVPAELLLAMGYVNTIWEMPSASLTDYEKGNLHGRGAYGIMQLYQNPEIDTLGEASSLTDIPEERLAGERSANIRGAAALLAEIQGDGSPESANGWQQTVAEYGDSELYANEVYELLKKGAAQTISTGERMELEPVEDAEVPRIFELQGRNTDYARAVWRPAYRGNYTRSRREKSYNIRRVVVHVVQGSYSSAINWFQNPSSQVSAHYVVSRNGAVAQCVRHKDIAYHAGNWNYNCTSVGIEHAGYGRNKSTWSKKMYNSSARLTAYITRRHKIPINRKTIIGHRNVPGGTRTCPGPHFNFKRYLNLVRRFR